MSKAESSDMLAEALAHPAWVRAEGVGYRIGDTPLLEDISFTARQGELIALVGPNGAGKSTMLSLLSGDLTPSQGRIELFGKPHGHWHTQQMAQLRSIMTQHNDQPFAYTVKEIVEMGRAPYPVSDSDAEIVENAMLATDVDTLAERDVTTLSGGEAARTVFARILTQQAWLVLLDEPTAPLDLKYQESLLEKARILTREGACVIVVLHDLSLAARYCDRIAMFAERRLSAIGSPAEVLTSQRILDVYGQQVEIMPHPRNGRPLVIPI